MMTLNTRAFPTLSPDEMARLSSLAIKKEYSDRDIVFKIGDQDVDLVVVESGVLEILNPYDNNILATHGPGQFSGEIGLLIGRPPLVTCVARGTTHVLRVPYGKLSEVLIKIPRLSDKLVIAFETRNEVLSTTPNMGFKVMGHGKCKHTTLIREFLYRNFIPFTWYDPDTAEGNAACASFGSPTEMPAVVCRDSTVLVRPTLQELSINAGIWRHFSDRTVDFAIIGAGPAGIAAAVYGASEGLSTLVLDGLGPGGQAGGSSKIENFMGFPAGLSGNELALRGLMQMLKFGAQLYAPTTIKELRPATDPHKPHEFVLDCGAVVHAKAVLIATGMRWRKLEAENADRYERAGIYYACTSVEAVLHEHDDVAVVGGGNSAGQAATYLADCCPGRTVHLFVRRQLGLTMSYYLCQRILSMPNIKVHNDSTIVTVHGEQFIEAVEVDCKGEHSRVDLRAIFVFIGADPCVDWLPDNIGKDSNGFILTGPDAVKSGKWPLKDREPCALETTIPGVLAAGDVRSGSTKRVGFAVGDGSQSVACVHQVLALGL